MPTRDARDQTKFQPRQISGYRPEMQEIDEPSHPLAKQLLAFWQSRSRDGALLSRDDIPTAEIANLMGYLYLVSPIDEAMSDWLYRLSGEVIKTKFGGTPVGSKLSEAHAPEHFASSLQGLRKTVERRRPRALRGRFLGVGRDFHEVEVLHLPILGPDKKTIWILGGLFFFN